MNSYQTGSRPGRQATSTPPPPHAPHAALLIDFDNVTLGIRSDLTKELRTLLNSDIIKGKVAVQRAYADWRRYPQYIVPLSESSIDLIFAPAFGTNKKNATDIRLAVDAIELVFTRPEIGTFILLSGDSDFSSLVIKLKEYGKYVVGVGIRESASDLLIQNCDEYFSYSDIVGLTKEVDVPSIQRDPWELVVEAVGQMARNDDVMRSDRLKQVMQQLDPNFDERNAGYNRFSKFVTEAGNRGLVRVTKLDNGQFEVAPAGAEPVRPATGRSTPAPSRRDAGPRREAPVPRGEKPEREENGRRGRRGRRGRSAGREREETPAAETPRRPAVDGPLTLAESFHLMQQALGELRTPVGHDQLRARMLALRGREDALLEPGRFARLLRQAHDAEVADVKKTGDDAYEVNLHHSALASRSVARGGKAEAPPPPPLEGAETPEQGEAPAATIGRASAVRFRRGSRGPVRAAEVPLVGAVSMEPEASGAVAAEEPRPKPRTRARPGTRKKKAAAKVVEPAVEVEPPKAEAKPAARRARPRTRKKATKAADKE